MLSLSLFFLPFSLLQSSPAHGVVSFACAQADPVLGHSYLAGCEASDRDSSGRESKVRINRLGLRAPEPTPRNAGVYRAVLLAPAMGLAPAGREGIVEAARSWLQRRGKRIEIVNASVPGYRLPQEYLRLPAILAAYQPDLVVAMHGLQSPSLAQAADHLFARERKSGALPTALGENREFWPLPLSWQPYLRSWLGERSESWRQRGQGLRLAIVKLCIRAGLVTGGQDFYVNNQLRYLRALRDLAKDKGASFLVADRETLDEDPARHFERIRALPYPIRPDYLTNRWLPWPHLRSEDLRRYRSELDESFFVAHLRENIPRETPLFEADGMTPTPSAARLLGEELAKAIILRANAPRTER